MRQSIFSPACAIAVTLGATLIATQYDAAAQRVARGGSVSASRSVSTANVNRSNYSGTASASRTTVNRNTQVNQNVNVNRNVNVNVDNYYRPGYGAAAVAGAAIVTAAAIGSVAHSIPPSCVPVVSGGYTYQRCGETWYQPQYAGTSVTYVVINPPQ